MQIISNTIVRTGAREAVCNENQREAPVRFGLEVAVFFAVVDLVVFAGVVFAGVVFVVVVFSSFAVLARLIGVSALNERFDAVTSKFG